VGKLLLVILVLGVAIYLTVRLIEKRRGRGGGGGSLDKLLRPKPPPNRPMGPDDDPDFLRDLNRRRPKRPKPDEG
jgi:hypothetical protein